MRGKGFNKVDSCPNNPGGFGCSQDCKGHGILRCWTCGKLTRDHPTLETKCQPLGPATPQ
jgi:hypothetical protein